MSLCLECLFDIECIFYSNKKDPFLSYLHMYTKQVFPTSPFPLSHCHTHSWDLRWKSHSYLLSRKQQQHFMYINEAALNIFHCDWEKTVFETRELRRGGGREKEQHYRNKHNNSLNKPRATHRFFTSLTLTSVMERTHHKSHQVLYLPMNMILLSTSLWFNFG